MIPGASPPLGARRSAFAVGPFLRLLRLALRSLWLHRLRSLLTVLGIVFGVCSVIAMLAIGGALIVLLIWGFATRGRGHRTA